MGWLLLQVLACTLGNASCGGGGGGSAADGSATATGMVSATAATAVTAAGGTAATLSTALATPATPLTATPPANGIDFSFTLDQARTTSAAVYAADGSLVRTLWRGERLSAGTQTRNWDQRDDLGATVQGSDFTIKLIHHDVRYVWEGVVGNSSARTGATALHKAFLVPASLAAGSGRMHYSSGYNEAQPGIHGFDLNDPQTNKPAVSLIDPFIAAVMIATDGQRLYWANAGGMASKSFIAAFDLASGRQAEFSQGQPLCLNYFANTTNCYAAQSYASVLERRDNLDSPPTGLAVQKNGRLLAVAYGGDNQVRLYDKSSGQLLRTLALGLAPKTSNQIAFAPSGDLWVLSGTSALRYTGLDGTPLVAARIVGLVQPLAVTVDGVDEDSVWVADGDSSQQLKRHDRNGRLGQVIGVAGGAAGKASVSTDRLCFQGPEREQTALAVDDRHALWVVDTCNNRMLQFTAGGSVADQIAYLPASYAAAADPGNPARVFANYMEFSVDYTQDLAGGKAWTLVRNWLNVLPASLRDKDSMNSQWGGFRSVQTLANGRTYAQIAQNGVSSIVELKADGTLALVKTLPAAAANDSGMVLYENGDLGYASTTGGRQTAKRYTLDRYDAQGAPVWATQPAVMASVAANPGTPYYRNGTFTGLLGPRFPVTGTGMVVFFDPSVDAASGFHLGAANKGGSSWAWQASPSGALDGLGSFQTKKVDPNINYGGNVVMAVGRSIVYGYHGEFYTDLGNGRVGQANQFMHFRDDGLFLGQFGVPSTRATSATQAGLSGNAFSPTLLRYGGQTYLYHNDESTQGGVHRWRLAGAEDVQELVGRGGMLTAINLR